MANIDKPAGFRVSAMPGSFPIYTEKTASNVTLNPGDAIIRLTTGLIGLALSTSASILGVSQSKITAEAGIQKDCKYVPALPGLVFSGQCSGTPTQSTIGEKHDIEGGTGVMEINEDAAVNPAVEIVGLEGGIKNSMGLNARLLFVWTNSAWTGQA